MFELLYLDFTQPKFDSKAIKAYILKLKSLLEYEDNEPRDVFQKDFKKIVFGNDPYFKPLEFSDLSKYNNTTAFKLVKKSLNPADYTFVFVGSQDVNNYQAYV